MAEKNYFEVLNNIDVGDKIEKKNGLSYLSWAWAWGEIKKRHPDAIYTIYENADGLFYHTDGKTAWVKTGVTVNGIEHIEYLPVMDYKNKSIPIENITSTDVNKAIQRSLTKAVARHGLGLYIYAGEDLPEEKKGTTDKEMDEHLEKKISANDVKIIEKMVEGKDALKTWVLQQCNVTKFEDMTNAQYGQAMRALNEHFEKKGK
jgi:hypothetical protein